MNVLNRILIESITFESVNFNEVHTKAKRLTAPTRFIRKLHISIVTILDWNTETPKIIYNIKYFITIRITYLQSTKRFHKTIQLIENTNIRRSVAESRPTGTNNRTRTGSQRAHLPLIRRERKKSKHTLLIKCYWVVQTDAEIVWKTVGLQEVNLSTYVCGSNM